MSCATEEEVTEYQVALGDGLSLLFPLVLVDTPVAISGWTPQFVITTDLDDPDVAPLCTIALATGLQVYDATTWLMQASALDLADAVAGTYHYAFRGLDPLGEPHTLETGYIVFSGAGPLPA